ncbi:MAG: hypothetical protein P8X91_07720 [Candidatus Bathyarchaeota archaeon]|jgi:hypothetical protein
MLTKIQMLGILIFAVASFFVFSITLLIPNFPPGKILVDFFKNTETTYTLAGFSGELLLIAVINGLIWGIIILLIYSYTRGPQKEKKTLPVWIPGYATSRSSKDSN